MSKSGWTKLAAEPGQVSGRIPRRMHEWRWDRRAYLWLRRLRDRGLRAAVDPLARLGVAPWAVSAAGVALAASTVWTLQAYPRWALASLLGALLCDALDGALARRLGCCGVKGKIVDHFCDMATFAGLLGAVVVAGLSPSGRAIAAIGLTLVSLTAAVLYRRRLGHTGESLLDGGFFVHLPKGLLYAALAVYLLGGPERLAETVWLLSLLAATVAVAYLVGFVASAPARQTIPSRE